jgi:ABC-type transport system substrate-binding protein
VLYGLNRDVILNRVLLAGRPQEGSLVVSGPFVTSTSVNDPTGYGADNTIKPVGYEPRLAMALMGVAQKELNPDEKPDAPVKKPVGRLIIAHPKEPVSRLACSAMVEQLKRIGIEVELKELDPTKADAGEDYDFRYAELAPWEPVVDARRLLGENGIAGTCSSYMSLALAKLDRADTWKEVRRRLGEVHRIAADELAIVPLYQTVYFYAYRRGSATVGKEVVRLYDHVETWKQHEPETAAR